MRQSKDEGRAEDSKKNKRAVTGRQVTNSAAKRMVNIKGMRRDLAGTSVYLTTPELFQVIKLGDVATVEGVQQVHQPLLVCVLQ